MSINSIFDDFLYGSYFFFWIDISNFFSSIAEASYLNLDSCFLSNLRKDWLDIGLYSSVSEATGDPPSIHYAETSDSYMLSSIDMEATY